MSSELALACSIGASLAASAVIWGWLRAPLGLVYAQLCARPGNTEFWSRYTLLMLVMGPLLVAVLFSPPDPAGVVEGVRRISLAVLSGQLAAFALVGRGLFKAVRRATGLDPSTMPAITDGV